MSGSPITPTLSDAINAAANYAANAGSSANTAASAATSASASAIAAANAQAATSTLQTEVATSLSQCQSLVVEAQNSQLLIAGVQTVIQAQVANEITPVVAQVNNQASAAQTAAASAAASAASITGVLTTVEGYATTVASESSTVATTSGVVASNAAAAAASASGAATSATNAAASATLAQDYATGFTIGTVTTGTPSATITGSPGSQTLNLVLSPASYTLPAASLSTLGGVEAVSQVAHQWVSYIDTSGIPHLVQPGVGDLSGFGSNVAAALGNTAGAAGGFALFSTLGTGAFTAAYSLPTATSSVLGGVKPDGTTITNSSGSISVTYGTAANTAAQGNDSRITGALQTSALGTGVRTALGVAIGNAGAPVLFNGAGGTPSSLALANATGLPISSGVSGLGSGVATALSNTAGASNGFALYSQISASPASFGDGSDGAVTISSGTTTLTRDMYYANLTLSGTGVLNTAGWRVFVSGTLDISAAAAGAIICNGPSGNAGTSSTAGAAVSATFSTSWALAQTSGAAASGASAGGATTSAQCLGGLGGVGGQGSGSYLGGAANGAQVVQRVAPLPSPYLTTPPYTAGNSGSGGGSTTSGMNNAGSGGVGAGIILIFARTINRGASTAVGAITANGGVGGAAYQGSAGNAGAGGGGGGGGGFVVFIFLYLTGSSASGAITANGGTGGLGYTNGSGAGRGGQGGFGGVIMLVNLNTGVITTVTGSAGSTSSSVTGGVAGTCSASL